MLLQILDLVLLPIIVVVMGILIKKYIKRQLRWEIGYTE